MNATEFALLMIRYGELTKELRGIERQLASAVLEMGSSQKIGTVTARYNTGRRTFDYEAAARAIQVPENIIEAYTTVTQIVKTDWKSVCEDVGIEDIPVKAQPNPSVKFIVEEEQDGQQPAKDGEGA